MDRQQEMEMHVYHIFEDIEQPNQEIPI